MSPWHAVGAPVPKARLLNPLGPYLGFAAHARLILDLVRRDVAGRYRGAMGGKLWAFLTPLLMLAVYSFVFGYIFQARWTAAETGNVSFPIVLFVGLIFANFFTECLNRAPGLVVSNPNYVKKVVFPLEVLPWVAVGTSLFHACVGVSVLLLAMVVTGTHVPATALLLPLVFVLFVPLVAGLTWFLAAMGVYFRDLLQFVTVLSTALVFLAPIFYPRTMLPEAYRWVLLLNPLSFIVESAHNLVLWGRLPDWRLVLAYLAGSLVIAWLGWMSFQLTRKGFADVI
jgi:ABC-type polysaccharide/polyol phosphate export systems, permease component